MDGVGLTLKPALQVLALLLLMGGFYVSCEESWCYDLPSCGPRTWRSRFPTCNGDRQSPINIDTRRTVNDACLGPIKFVGYGDRLRPTEIKNTGHYAEVEMKSGATISGGGLPGTYQLRSFHFHMGTYNRRGSEHAINGRRHSMELHIVHTKENLSPEEAKKDPEGYAVLAFFIQKSRSAPVSAAWKTLADLMETIPEKNDSTHLNGEFSLGALLSRADLSKYARYKGSLTTPICNQAVIWTVYEEPILVPHYVAKKFTESLYFTTKEEGRKMQNNYRPLQPVNQRKILCFSENESPYYQDCYGHREI
ncbi:carbonic anhydrase 4-like [Hemicordylus capensis]|uniref:carbonic anhydrase 4-like n=1 Tax=Hemicordylus capensis TaxID=884348 RepID=UPI002302D902|nr:carbonic anhydrase 4-like [Hemicordylus capensis]XP_053121022.1 carbonic anhydrase 4-like [Hemicordylus capensis]XP_053121023.1 carbonic anhydrase 4-like [Hemicordylus capensis]XP_053121024.1 carbonic anhydrase 4-like [Hemicordylus capensis]